MISKSSYVAAQNMTRWSWTETAVTTGAVVINSTTAIPKAASGLIKHILWSYPRSQGAAQTNQQEHPVSINFLYIRYLILDIFSRI